jgi:type I restriction enzyme, S subunit
VGIEHGKLPAGWRWAKLGNVAEIIAGQSPPSSTYNALGKGIPFFQGKADFGPSEPRVRVWTTAPTKIAVSGDILISVRAPVGPTNVCAERCCLGRGLAAIRAFEELEPKYLGAYLSSVEQDWAVESSGSTFQSISSSHLRNRLIPVPPIAEQRRIIARLMEHRVLLGLACSEAEAQVREVEALFQKIVTEALGPGVRLPEDQVDPPKGWRWRRLLDVAKLESGHTPSRRVPQWWGGDVPWLALPDIRELDGRTALSTKESTNSDGLANSSARLLPTGTVCLSRTASVGYVTVLGKPMATSQDFVNWICGPALDPWFLARALIASRAYLVSLASGAIHKTIYVPTVKTLSICLPSDVKPQAHIVKELAERSEALSAVRLVSTEQVKQIRALEVGLRRAAFSGAL